MQTTKALSFKKEIAISLTKFVVILGIATFAPLIGQQSITGPIVNAALIISTILLGVRGAILIAIIPSIVSLSVGLLPAVLAPMVPFIILSNMILVLVFDYIKKNYWRGIVAASILKFLFLFSTSYLVVNLIAKSEIAQKAAAIMSWPQLLTALGGGIVAYIVLKVIKKI